MVYTYTLQEYHLVHVFVILLIMREHLSRQLDVHYIYLHLFSAWMMGLNGAIIVDGI
jgi:hypothetical protein